MPYKLDWVVPGKVLFGRMWGEPQADEIREFSLSISRTVADAQPPVHCVLDVTQISRTPFNLRELNSFLNRDHTSNFGWLVLISDNLLARFLGTAVLQLAQMRVRVFNDRPSALRFLNEIDSALPDLAAIDSDSQIQPSDS